MTEGTPHGTAQNAIRSRRKLRDAVTSATTRQTLFFLLAGGIAFLIYLGISSALHYAVGVDESWAALGGALAAIPPAFLMQRNLTFRSNVATRKALPRYVLLQIINAVFISAASKLGAYAGIPAFAAFVLAGAAGTGLSYWAQSRLVFRSPSTVEKQKP